MTLVWLQRTLRRVFSFERTSAAAIWWAAHKIGDVFFGSFPLAQRPKLCTTSSLAQIAQAFRLHLRKVLSLVVADPRIERMEPPEARMALVIRMLPVRREGDWLPAYLPVGLPSDRDAEASYDADDDAGSDMGTPFMICSCSAAVDGRCFISARRCASSAALPTCEPPRLSLR